VLDLQKAKDAQAKEIDALKKRIQRLERRKISRPTGLKRLKKVGMSRRVESSADLESLGVPEDASKQGRSIKDIDADIDISLVDETQERQDDDLIFDIGVLDDVEMPVEAKVDGKDEQRTKKLYDSTVGEAVTTAGDDSESKEKKEEGREETTKGSRKKMLRRKRAGKGQQQESSKKQKVEEEKESDTIDEYDEAELKKLLRVCGTLSVDNEQNGSSNEIFFNDKDATRNRQRRLGSSLEDSEG
ncbi:hypothetical protein Tco_1530793, partial [Tanacetum coccineum]